jgi:Vault protein inter-alpha-trypsin domain/FecR protein/von Willebrand factor type A domain
MNTLCTEVIENMADVLDGSADQRLLDHIADCDACRDARHDAERGRELVEKAGADFVVPADLEARLVAALERRKPAAPPAATPTTAPRPAPARVMARPRNWRQIGIAAGASLVIGAAAAMIVRLGHGPSGSGVASVDSWQGRIARVSRAGGGAGGLTRCDSAGRSCAPIDGGADVAPGSRLRTDELTRAYLRLADGSQLALDRSTEIVFGRGRRAELVRGAIAADVAHLPTGTARFDLPQGRAEVLGTKFALRADDAWTSVDVSRGAVRLHDGKSRSVTVRAGEEGRIFTELPPDVGAAPDLGETLVWGEGTGQPQQDEEASVRGLGELRAKKPGSQRELDRAVRLRSHAVKVRIAGAVARTEVDEVFTNETGDVLEGIYRFPLPPDAKIERLALEVDGRMEEGAFVDRDRAAAIWRGAIAHAAPHMPKPKEEIVWVPGPWKDPALLEWQRGGRFELRIFPIPRHGSRRIVLAYTQTLSPAGGMRRYAYPLAHDPAGSTRVDRFDIDVQVRGHDPQLGVRAYGYPLRREKDTNDGAAAMAWSASGFVPSGDLQIMFPPADRDSELSAWSYAAGSSPSPNMSADGSYVAIALRPRLPRVEEQAQRDFVLVVDSSRSMFGETYQRAVQLAARFVKELDPADRVTVLACDSLCRTMPGGPVAPGPETAVQIGKFLAGITPDGASDVAGAIAAAVAAGGRSQVLRVIYFGDGASTMGPARPASLTRAVAQALPAGRGTVTAVAIGPESDLQMLGALARGGGGVVLPHVPGQTTAEAAFAVLGSVYGNALRDVALTLPEALHEIAPRKLDTIPAGGEAFVVARLAGGEAAGTVVLRGKVGARDFEQRYPLRIAGSTAAGNAFVPRLYAAVRIADLEHEDAPETKQRAIELSSRFNVASRYTSLLVLESPAMFRAFGLDNIRTTPEWTGEEAAEGTTADGEVAITAGKPKESADPFGSANFGTIGKAKADGRGVGGLGMVGTGSGGGGTGEGTIGAARAMRHAGKDKKAAPAPAAPAPAIRPKKASLDSLLNDATPKASAKARAVYDFEDDLIDRPQSRDASKSRERSESDMTRERPEDRDRRMQAEAEESQRAAEARQDAADGGARAGTAADDDPDAQDLGARRRGLLRPAGAARGQPQRHRGPGVAPRRRREPARPGQAPLHAAHARRRRRPGGRRRRALGAQGAAGSRGAARARRRRGPPGRSRGRDPDPGERGGGPPGRREGAAAARARLALGRPP